MTMHAVPTPITEPPPDAERTPRPAPIRLAPPATGSDAQALTRLLRRDTPFPTEHLLRARGRLPLDHPDRHVLRARAVEDNLPLANRLAWRYAGRGERYDDLRQVAALALVKAVDGYDPDRATLFVSYAAPTIIGALKRHFRDTAWAMRVPRAAQELLLKIPAATEHLTRLRGRSPTSVELADHLHVTLDVMWGAVSASQVYRLPSLNESVTGHDGAGLADLVGAVDPHYDAIDDHLTLGPLVAALPPRQRRILTMRFSEDMTQARIGAELGMSQMHVSRLLRAALVQLRAGFLAETDGSPAEGPPYAPERRRSHE